ncbi:transposase [Streptomyces misionensis]|uniref:transposase n=1 Tax=Streptomyces misionensis TaxID=67331 RepID=UPI0036FBAB0A
MGTYKYSAEFWAAPVAPARSSGRPVSRIAAELGVNHETLRRIKAAGKAERPEAVAESAKDSERPLHDRLPRAGRLRAEIN